MNWGQPGLSASCLRFVLFNALGKDPGAPCDLADDAGNSQWGEWLLMKADSLGLLQESNLSVCQENLKSTESSLDLIKDFLTTTEVCLAQLLDVLCF